MFELLLVTVLLAAGAIPLLPLTVAEASRSDRAAVRVPAKLFAFVFLYACFILSAGGLLAGFIMAFGKLGPYVIIGGVAVFLLAGAWLSHRVVFRPG